MAAVYHVESWAHRRTMGGGWAQPQRVAKERTTRRHAAAYGLHCAIYNAAEAQALLASKAAWDALRKAAAWAPERGDDAPLELTVGDYLITAQRVDA